MVVTGAPLLSNSIVPVIRCCMPPQSHARRNIPSKNFSVSTGQTLISPTSTLHEASASFEAVSSPRKVEKNVEDFDGGGGGNGGYDEKKKLKDFFEESKSLIGSDCGAPPRWFSPVECSSRLENSPLLLYLPGLDGVGLGLIRHHHNLGKIFDIWCLHIPVKDRTSFTGLVKMVERKVRTENQRSPNRPIYLIGESIGACIALSVAAYNPDVDLVLIVSNPATSFVKSELQFLLPLLELIPDQLPISHSFILSLMAGDPLRMTIENMVKQLPRQRFDELALDVIAMSSYLSVLQDILPRETLLWKLKLLKTGSAYTNARIHAIKAETLILASGKDQLLPSVEEGERLYHVLPKSEIRKFNNNGHFLFLEDGIDLVTIIKCTTFYRRGKYYDPVADYMPPTPTEFNNIVYDEYRLLIRATSPVTLSTLEDGKIVKGLSGIPTEGPVLFVGYHMLLGMESGPIVTQFWLEKNILLRGITHPLTHKRLGKGGMLPPLSDYDKLRIIGAVPASGTNLYKLLSAKSHVLLCPGGIREACHRKGEQYKLMWPEQSEFVRMAARFGAKIVPFGAVGEDDLGEVVFDYDDQMKVPFIRDLNEQLNNEAVAARTIEIGGEVGNQPTHIPGILPKFPPGRFYFYFGKPIETEGRRQELSDKDKAHELYLQVKSEVENCLAFLKEKRETDPYRNMFPRLAYQATHGIDIEVPTFDI